MPTFRETAIVLAIRPVKDADRRYVLFTAGRGKIELLAKGVRRGKSKMSPHLGTPGESEVMFARGRRFDRLAGASLVRPFHRIGTDLSRLVVAQAFLLTIDALTRREQPDTQLYDYIIAALAELEAMEKVDRHHALRFYTAAVIKLLDQLGFGFELDVCVTCRRKLTPDGNALDFNRGGVVGPECRTPEAWPVNASLIKALRFYRERPLSEAVRLHTDAPTGADLWRTLESLLQSHLDHRLPALEYLRICA